MPLTYPVEVADIAIMLALMAARNVEYSLSVVQSGKWPTVGWAPFGFCGPQLGPGPVAGKTFTVGFLGFGRISQATLHRLVPFGVTHAIYTDSGRGGRSSADDEVLRQKYAGFGRLEEVRRVTLDELAQNSDLVILLAPGKHEALFSTLRASPNKTCRRRWHPSHYQHGVP